MNFLAHSGQSLPAHLAAVAKRAESFAMEFDSGAAGWLAGILHDLGKAEDEFQKRIALNDHDGKKEAHAHHGAAWVLDKWFVEMLTLFFRSDCR